MAESRKNYQIFSDLIARGVLEGKIPARTQAARNWFREAARRTQTTGNAVINMAKIDRSRRRPVIGRMFLFRYDPKWKDELPYYDVFPLIFPIDHYEDGFLGINFHYLPLRMRAKLMDLLYPLVNNKKYDYTTKLKLSYRVLKSAAKYKYFRPCVKRYLYSHVKSPLVEIYSAEWDVACFLPLASFRKASQTKVWMDSEKIIRGY